jgi:hypothetical protein
VNPISNIPYNLIFATKFNDSSILITIISCDYLNFQRWVFGEEAVNNNIIVFGLIRLGLGSTIYNTWEEHDNHYTTATVKFLQDIY